MERGQVSGQGPAALLVELATAGLCGHLFLERVPRSEVGAILRESGGHHGVEQGSLQRADPGA